MGVPANHDKSFRAVGNLLVILQFAALTIVAAHMLPALFSWPSAVVILGAVVLMGWSLVSMGKVTFKFHPDPSEQGKLQTGGAYRWLRHPMYTSATLASLAVLWKNPAPGVIVSVGVVIIVLYLKMQIEESALRSKFPEYADYARNVPALIPFLVPSLRSLFSKAKR